jgi:adenylate kinase family enzyme
MIVGIIGPPGGGKTTMACTFPKPLVLDFDKKLPVGIDHIPFWNPEVCDDLAPRRNKMQSLQQTVALKNWLKQHGTALDSDTTLIIDSMTMVGSSFDRYMDENPVVSRTGVVDKFAGWQDKIKYFRSTMELLKTLPCSVVITYHQQAERGPDGELTGGYKILISGQTGDILPAYHTHWLHLQAIKDRKTNVIRRVVKTSPTQHIFAFLPAGWATDQPEITPTYNDLMKLSPNSQGEYQKP